MACVKVASSESKGAANGSKDKAGDKNDYPSPEAMASKGRSLRHCGSSQRTPGLRRCTSPTRSPVSTNSMSLDYWLKRDELFKPLGLSHGFSFLQRVHILLQAVELPLTVKMHHVAELSR